MAVCTGLFAFEHFVQSAAVKAFGELVMAGECADFGEFGFQRMDTCFSGLCFLARSQHLISGL
ncbi:hypothetical protein GALL_543660 [mine drainage metagenome]|uniref:Uncharacterized protein n=1 Tax=mine drainage metagenome TaxID=410659 RepID=A0A1J5P8F5_9ZZZZ